MDPKKRKAFDEDILHDLVVKKTKLVPDSGREFNEETGATTGNGPDQVWDLCDDVCALCDNGGELLCCEGRCLRSFHGTVDTGFQSGCKSLGLSKDQVKATQNFFCMNCRYNQHQCFACGKLGSSNRTCNSEVFRCASATCGHFYHPRCVAKLLHPINEIAAGQMQRKIIAGESFTCSVHKCFLCKQEENKDKKELQFAICRRCPRVYHRKCLPRVISFESLMNEGILQRAWDDLIPDRILMYCLKHKIDVGTLAPERDHIIFPQVQGKKKICPPDSQPGQGKNVAKKISVDFRNRPKRDPVNHLKQVGRKPCAIKNYNSSKIHVKQASRESFGSIKKSQKIDASRLHLKDRVNWNSMKVDKSSPLHETNVSLKEKSLNPMLKKGSQSEKPKQHGVPCKKPKMSVRYVPVTKKPSTSPSSVRTETEARKVDLMDNKSSTKTMEIGTTIPKEASQQVYSNNIVDSAIPLGNVEDSDKAVEASVQKLEDDRFGEPRASYEPEIFNHLTELEAVEASVQMLEDDRFGEPRTSYEPEIFNHVTKSEIADKLHWYAQSGDTIVNFCCPGNDFSSLMAQKLEEAGKRCSLKNYDVFQSKGDLDFVKEDWMPTGSRLMMVLIFPSGVGALVNKFIDMVLEFKPKLLVLICPRETKRLDDNESGYDLIWEEGELILSKSCLPVSMFLNQQRKGRTTEVPLLYVWSRCDWASIYKSIALKQGHISNEREDPNMKSETETNELEDPNIESETETNEQEDPNVENETNERENPNMERETETNEQEDPNVEINTNEREDPNVEIETNEREDKENKTNEHEDPHIESKTNLFSTGTLSLFNGDSLFALGPLCHFSNRSCGWLDE